MSKMIFINLPVTDLAKSIAFYGALGGVKNPKFSDDTAASMVLSDTIHVMLLTHEKYAQFSPHPIPDAHKSAQVLLCLTADSRAEVDAQVEATSGFGGRIDPTPADDYGFMYGRSLEDPDGHLWQIFWMDPVAAEKGPEAFMAEQAVPA